jgi:hypothetical protein
MKDDLDRAWLFGPPTWRHSWIGRLVASASLDPYVHPTLVSQRR